MRFASIMFIWSSTGRGSSKPTKSIMNWRRVLIRKKTRRNKAMLLSWEIKNYPVMKKKRSSKSRTWLSSTPNWMNFSSKFLRSSKTRSKLKRRSNRGSKASPTKTKMRSWPRSWSRFHSLAPIWRCTLTEDRNSWKSINSSTSKMKGSFRYTRSLECWEISWDQNCPSLLERGSYLGYWINKT